jgi:hypothetical protein
LFDRTRIEDFEAAAMNLAVVGASANGGFQDLVP